MSYILFNTSSGGSGVQNPLTANLDAAGFEITGAGAVSSNVVIAGQELTHSDPVGAIGFFGVPPVGQGIVAHPIVGADPAQNENTINQLCAVLQQMGLIA